MKHIEQYKLLITKENEDKHYSLVGKNVKIIFGKIKDNDKNFIDNFIIKLSRNDNVSLHKSTLKNRKIQYIQVDNVKIK